MFSLSWFPSNFFPAQKLKLWAVWQNENHGVVTKPQTSHTANYYSHSTAFVQSKDCNANLITAIDSALSLTVIHYSQTTANVQLMTALIAKSDNN